MSKTYDKATQDRLENAREAEAANIDVKRLIRRVDYRLVPWLSFLYLLSFLDRTNIGNANLFGLSTDLGLTATQYSTCLAIFFAFYVIFEVPSNMVMKAWRPSMWLPIIMIGWGIVITLTGIVQNFGGLFAARVFLGITEAGLFPGVSFFLTQWYRKYEVNLRIAVFFSAATAAGAFGGLLARLINLMDGVAGYEGWRWIFILEGIATVVAAVASFWLLYDYPGTASFLNEDEKKFLNYRLSLDTNHLSTLFKKRFVYDGLLDWKIWVLSFIYIGALMPVYCFSLFSPTLVAGLGYSAATAQLLSVPPYVLAAITTVLAGFLSDKSQKRGVYILGASLLGAVGFIMNIATANPAVGYVGLFLAAAGVYPLIPLVVSWSGNNIGGATKRAVGMAIVISVGNCGGIISSFIYQRSYRPRYYIGHGVCIAFLMGLTFCGTLFMMAYYKRQNSKREERSYTEEEYLKYEDEGDNAPYFRYTL